MLGAIVRWSLARPRLIAAGALVLLVYGLVILSHARFDVFPDFVPAQVEIQTEAPGLSAEQVEQRVTRPVEEAINGAAGVASLRSDSIQGLSIITVGFTPGSDPYRARQVVSEALGEAVSSLPTGVATPRVAPLTSATMDLLKVGFTSDRLTPMALRDLIRTTVQPRLLASAGVARATLYGGAMRRIEVRVRPADLAARDISLDDVLSAARLASGSGGGGFIDTPEQRILIEPHGQALTAADVGATVVQGPSGGVPVRLGDVADVLDAPSPEMGDALIMGKPGVLLSLSSQYGANTLEATRAVEAALSQLGPSLEAQGVHMEANLHRPANFISTALQGMIQDLVVGAVLIGLVLFVFMGNLRTVAVSFISIPLSLLAAIIVMDGLGWTINTMTLGGLAVALGVVVDDAVIDVENIVRRLKLFPGRPRGEVVLAASLEVRAPVIYATLVVALALLPVLLLHGLQGAFFAPLAAAFILATLASLAVAVVVTPPLCLLLLRADRLSAEPQFLTRAKAWHERGLIAMAARPRWAVLALVIASLATVGGLTLFNSELLPSFRESHFVLGVAGPPGTSLGAMRRYGEAISQDLLAVPGIQTVEQQIGRAEGGEDTWGPERSEFHVELKPGLSGQKQDAIQARIHDILASYPGLSTEVLTFLGDRIGESLSGETASLVVSIYGPDLDILDQVAGKVAHVLSTVPGTVDTRIQTPPLTPVVRIDLDLPALARWGLSPGEVLQTIQFAYQGTTVTQVVSRNQSVDVAVTLAPDLRQDPESVGDLLLKTATGSEIHLSQVARLRLAEGRTLISHEGGQPRQVVTTNPPPAMAGKVTRSAMRALADLKLPPGVFLTYTGTAEASLAARRDLLFNLSLAAGGMFGLLLIAFGRARTVGLILGLTPFSLLGGVLAVGLTGGSLSLGALVGFVTLFGVSARNAILLISHIDHLVREEGESWTLPMVLRATRERITPILMTALVTALGVAPLAFETGQAGREIQGPMALVILGGLVTSTLASLIVLPALAWRFGRTPEARNLS